MVELGAGAPILYGATLPLGVTGPQVRLSAELFHHVLLMPTTASSNPGSNV